jgi:WhiB family redox-sensing transcriptional regulator
VTAAKAAPDAKAARGILVLLAADGLTVDTVARQTGYSRDAVRDAGFAAGMTLMNPARRNGGMTPPPPAPGTPARADVAGVLYATFGPAIIGSLPAYDGPTEAELAAEERAWQDRALCAQTDPEAFFPEKGGSSREAKRVCRGCEVRRECLEYALARDERFGIWGGLSERERRRLKRRGAA